jgi:hypothetical protein
MQVTSCYHLAAACRRICLEVKLLLPLGPALLLLKRLFSSRQAPMDLRQYQLAIRHSMTSRAGSHIVSSGGSMCLRTARTSLYYSGAVLPLPRLQSLFLHTVGLYRCSDQRHSACSPEGFQHLQCKLHQAEALPKPGRPGGCRCDRMPAA